MNRQVAGLRKEAQLASMEQVTRLRDELAKCQDDYRALSEAFTAVRKLHRFACDWLIKKSKRIFELERETHRWRNAYNEMKQHLEDEKRDIVRRICADHDRQIRLLTNHIATMSGVPRVVIDLSRKCPETKSECRERYINGGLPADVNEWMRNCDVQKAPSLDIRGPSC